MRASARANAMPSVIAAVTVNAQGLVTASAMVSAMVLVLGHVMASATVSVRALVMASAMVSVMVLVLGHVMASAMVSVLVLVQVSAMSGAARERVRAGAPALQPRCASGAHKASRI